MANDIDITIRGIDKSKDAFAAAKRSADDFAEHVKKGSKRAGDDISDAFKRGGDRGFKGIAAGAASAAAGIAGKIGDGLGSALGKDPKIAAGITAAGIAAAPFLGAAIQGAVLGGAGVGGVIGGLMLVKDDPRVKQAGTDLGDALLGQMQDSAGVFVQPTLRAIDEIDARAKRLKPEFDSLFSASAGYLEPLTDGLLDAAEGIMDGLVPAIGAAGPVIDQLSVSAGNLGETIGDVFKQMEDDGPAAAEALGFTFGLLEGSIAMVGDTTNALTEVYKQLSGNIHILLGDLEGGREILTGHGDAVHGVARHTKTAAESSEYWTEKQIKLNDALYGAATAAGSAIEAQIRYRDAVKDAHDAVDGHTGASDEEMTALLRVANSANAATNALLENGAAVGDVTAATQAGQRDVYNLGRAMGLSEEQARAYSRTLVAVPDQVATDVKLRGVEAAKAQAANLSAYLRNIPDEVINVITNLTGATGSRAAAGLQKQYAMAHGGIAGANIGAAATGGIRGNWTKVGEQGPELVKLPFGSTVYSAGQSQAMESQAGGGGRTVIEVVARRTGDDIMDTIMQMIQFKVRTEGGGDVVAYLNGVS